MKRDLKPFVVEVKRGKRRPAGSQFDMRDPDASFSEAARRAELALFATPPVEKAVAKVAASPRPEPSGRVLPSLVEIPFAVEREDEPPPRRRGRKPGSKNKPKVLNGVHPAPTGAPRADHSARISIKPGDGARLPRPIIPAPRHVPPTIRLETAKPAVGAASAAAPKGVTGTTGRQVRLRDRSSILARYVLGTEPGPGERWKRKSRRNPDLRDPR